MVLPASAVIELSAVTVFALNMAITLVLPPPVPAAPRARTLPVLSGAQ
jgi:hypothetical protein